MKKKLKIIQVTSFVIATLIVMRSELLHIIRINDYHFFKLYVFLFFTSLIGILLYPLYDLFENNLLNPIKLINKLINSIKNYVNN